MDRLSAPQQNRMLGGIAELLRKIERDSGPEFLPRGLDVMGLVRQLALPSAETVEKLSYGDPLFRMPTQSNIPITTDKGYLAEVLGMAPVVPAASRATTRISNEVADQLVKAITRNPEATAPGALQAAGEMAPLARMFKPEQVKSVLPETKIVDESGNPKLMYHGTREDFEQFDTGTRGAVFASPDPKFTNVYAGEDMDQYLSGGNVRPVYVDAKNPFDYDNPDHVQAVVQYIKKNDPDFADIADSVGEKVGTGVYSQIERPLVQNAIRQLGFDGFFVQERGIKNIAVFDPRQIKSATSDSAFAGLLEPQAGAKTSSKKWTEEEIAVFNEQRFQKQLMQAIERDRLSQENKQLAKEFIEKLPSMGVAKDFTKDQLDSISYYRLAGDRKGAMEEGASQTVNLLEKKLKDMGVQIVHKSNIDGGNSIYANVNGKIVRISDHYLPETPERSYKGNKWDNEVITYDWANTNLDDYLKRITSPVVE